MTDSHRYGNLTRMDSIDKHAINKGILQVSIMDTRRARHQTHSRDVAQVAPHIRIGGIWIDGGTDESGHQVPRISWKERKAAEQYLREDEQGIDRRYHKIA